jgi:hypothetical protein
MLQLVRQQDDGKERPAAYRRPARERSGSAPLDDYLDNEGRCESTILNLRAGPVNVSIGDGHMLHLAPLERREILPDESSRIDGDKVRRSRYIKIESVRGEAGRFKQITGRAVAFARLIVALAVLVGPALVLAFTALGLITWSNAVWLVLTAIILIAIILLAVVWIWALGQRSELVRVRRYVSHTASQIAVTVVAVFLPGVVTWYLGGFRVPVRNIVDLDTMLANPETTAMAIAWLLRWIFISCASLLPALLYFLFDRSQLSTLKREFIRDVFRLEPDVETLSDLDAKYGPQIEEMYGSKSKRSGRLAAGTRWPVIFATVLLATGWTGLMIHADQGSAMAPVENGFRFIDFLKPPGSLAGFAFLGAYVFGVRAALRGHLRGDLRAKSYSTMSVRLLVVVVIAWVLEAIVGPSRSNSGMLEGAAFFAGFFPDEWLRFLNDRVNSTFRRLRPLLGRSTVPVSDLDSLTGLDIYDRARLAEEGVDNVQALAKPDLVSLLMHTRIPSARLLDWVDQAVLQVYAGPVCADDDEGGVMNRRLREAGIRRATQLLNRPPAGVKSDPSECAHWETLTHVVREDPIVEAIYNWRATRIEERDVVEVDAAFETADAGEHESTNWRIWPTSLMLSWNGAASTARNSGDRAARRRTRAETMARQRRGVGQWLTSVARWDLRV